MVTIYGLDKCDTCAKARRWLDRHAVAHRFVDYRREPIAADTLKSWAKAHGWDALVNKSGTTWRALPPIRRAPGSDAEWLVLLRDHPSLLRRPVIVLDDGTMKQGFSDKLYAGLFAP